MFLWKKQRSEPKKINGHKKINESAGSQKYCVKNKWNAKKIQEPEKKKINVGVEMKAKK